MTGGKAGATDPRRVLDDLRDGSASISEFFEAAETDDTLGDIPVLEAIDAVVGGRTAQVLRLTHNMAGLVEDLRVRPMASVRDLGDAERETLMQKLQPVPSPPGHDFPAAGLESAAGGILAGMAVAQFGERGAAYQQIAAQAAEVHEQLVASLRSGASTDAAVDAGAVYVIAGGDPSAGKSSALRQIGPGGVSGGLVSAGSGIHIKIFDGVIAVKKVNAPPRGEIPSGDQGVAKAAPQAGASEPTRRDLVDAVAVLAEAQLRLLAELDSAAVVPETPRVSLHTPTGAVEYQLPISIEDTYSPAQVGELLSPSGKGHRSLAQNRRQSNKLLAIRIDGQQYRYPKFQIDEARRTIRPVAAYANQLLEASQDPWGVLDWWYSEDEGLDDRRPVDMLESGELTEELVDLAVGLSRQAMD